MHEPTTTLQDNDAIHIVSPNDHDTDQQRSLLEQTLKHVLQEHHGSTKHVTVRRAIDELTPLNPTPEPTTSPLLVGDFICHTIPEFPGRLKRRDVDPSVVQYTLGRLSFGVFQPHNLVCTVRSVRQAIRVRKETSSGHFKMYNYPVMMDITIHATATTTATTTASEQEDNNTTTTTTIDLPAIISHDAICYKCPSPKNNHRLKVVFSGSTLMPAPAVLQDAHLLETWRTTFQGAYTKAAQERNFLSRTLRQMIAWWFQMTLPSDDEFAASKNHSVHFELHKRTPKGFLDILYLSPSTRITKGNRGTLVVVEPMVGMTNVQGGGEYHTPTTTTSHLDLNLMPEHDQHDNADDTFHSAAMNTDVVGV